MPTFGQERHSNHDPTWLCAVSLRDSRGLYGHRKHCFFAAWSSVNDAGTLEISTLLTMPTGSAYGSNIKFHVHCVWMKFGMLGLAIDGAGLAFVVFDQLGNTGQ
jgi:hypothetical protein